MKIRNGFVSNSSSSSFIVAIEKGKTKGKVKFEIDLENYVGSYGRRLKTQKELDDYFLSEYVYDCDTIEEFLKRGEDEYEVELYNKCLPELLKGKEILFGRFSSEGEVVEEFLHNNGLSNIEFENDVTIIEDEGGY